MGLVLRKVGAAVPEAVSEVVQEPEPEVPAVAGAVQEHQISVLVGPDPEMPAVAGAVQEVGAAVPEAGSVVVQEQEPEVPAVAEVVQEQEPGTVQEQEMEAAVAFAEPVGTVGANPGEPAALAAVYAMFVAVEVAGNLVVAAVDKPD